MDKKAHMSAIEQFQIREESVWSIMPPEEACSPDAEDDLVNFMSRLVTGREFSEFEANPAAARDLLEALRDAEHKQTY